MALVLLRRTVSCVNNGDEPFALFFETRSWEMSMKNFIVLYEDSVMTNSIVNKSTFNSSNVSRRRLFVEVQ